MAPSRKLSLTSAVWICFCIGGVAFSFISAQGNNETTTEAAGATTTTGLPSTVNASDTTFNGTTQEVNATTTTEPTTGNDTTPFSNETTATTELPTTQNTTFNPNATTQEPGNGTTEVTSPIVTSPIVTSPSKTTTASPSDDDRKFDVASFFGGAATAVAFVILIFIAVKCYTHSKKTRYHAM
ncbi:integumentary mucin C.1-like [Littorina saxatilis]|uniref:Uncharacterized protein n=1 Tax=Littorina saxatilis TaxID=31220 RepID=A0AAN9BNI4_9CAEN